MKLSILATLAILVLAAILGSQHRQRIVAARQTHDRLRAEARSLGLHDAGGLAETGAAHARSRPLRPPAADRTAATKDLAKRMATFVREMEQAQQPGAPPIENFQEKIFLLLDELVHLDAAQLKVLTAELRNDPSLDGAQRAGLIGLAISTLAQDHPAAALALAVESIDLLPPNNTSRVFSAAISRLAQLDPAAAISWVRDYESKHPGIDPTQLRRDLIAGTAKRDPAQAFQLIHDLGETKAANEMASAIAESATNPAERTAVLSALRDHLKAQPNSSSTDLANAALVPLARQAVMDGFQSGAAWLDSADLSLGETEATINQLNAYQTGKDTGKWIDWMAGKLPPEKLQEKVGELVHHWTQTDYRAAGEWLLETPPGPAKTVAVKSYAQAIAPHNPETATEWALTLPPGPDRTELLQSIESVKGQ